MQNSNSVHSENDSVVCDLPPALSLEIAGLARWLISNGHDESRLQRILAICTDPAPKDWHLVAVNEGFAPLMDALDRADRKGYLPDAMTSEWAQFEYQAVTELASINQAQTDAYAEGRKDEREDLEARGFLADCPECHGAGEREVCDTSSGPDVHSEIITCPDCDGTGYARKPGAYA